MIEKYTRNTRFCLICNYVSKIIPALQSRCTRFRFAPLSPEDVTSRLQHISQEEQYVGRGACSAYPIRQACCFLFGTVRLADWSHALAEGTVCCMCTS